MFGYAVAGKTETDEIANLFEPSRVIRVVQIGDIRQNNVDIRPVVVRVDR